MDRTLQEIRIVLVESAGALNVGSVARVMKNMGLYCLVLVNPQCDHLGDEARMMAVHGREILEQAVVVPTLPAALAGCTKAIATTGVSHTLNTPLETPRNALPWLIDSHPTALIFGREDRGLTNAELNYAQRLVCIPTDGVYPSLNLAQAVAICCYELYQIQHQGAELSPGVTIPAVPTLEMAPLDAVEGYYQQLESVLLKMGYLYPHTAASRMEKFRRIYHRSQLTHPEVAMLRGVLSQMEWALQFLPEDKQTQ